MGTAFIYIIIFAAAILIVFVSALIRKKINDGIDNAVDRLSANIRNKKYEKQGSQNLADRFNNNQNNNQNGNQS